MLLVLIWVSPIIALLWIKWTKAAQDSTISDVLATSVRSKYRERQYLPIDANQDDILVFIPIIGIFYVLFVLLEDPKKVF